MHESNLGPAQGRALLIGQPESSCANARAIFHFLARDPLYGKLSLSAFPEVDFAMQRGHMLCARGPEGLVGVACWKRLTDHRARQAIAEQRMPGGGEQLGQGDAVLLTLMAGGASGAGGVIAALARRTFAHHQGRIVLYERHRVRGQVRNRFAWVDKAGTRLGMALG